jgi:hypothetical protein
VGGEPASLCSSSSGSTSEKLVLGISKRSIYGVYDDFLRIR